MNVRSCELVSLFHSNVFAAFLCFNVSCQNVFVHFAGETMLKEICTALLEAEHEASGMIEQNVRGKKKQKKLVHTHHHTHILELEHKLKMQQRLFVQVNYVSVVLAFPVCCCSVFSVQ